MPELRPVEDRRPVDVAVAPGVEGEPGRVALDRLGEVGERRVGQDHLGDRAGGRDLVDVGVAPVQPHVGRVRVGGGEGLEEGDRAVVRLGRDRRLAVLGAVAEVVRRGGGRLLEQVEGRPVGGVAALRRRHARGRTARRPAAAARSGWRASPRREGLKRQKQDEATFIGWAPSPGRSGRPARPRTSGARRRARRSRPLDGGRRAEAEVDPAGALAGEAVAAVDEAGSGDAALAGGWTVTRAPIAARLAPAPSSTQLQPVGRVSAARCGRGSARRRRW